MAPLAIASEWKLGDRVEATVRVGHNTKWYDATIEAVLGDPADPTTFVVRLDGAADTEIMAIHDLRRRDVTSIGMRGTVQATPARDYDAAGSAVSLPGTVDALVTSSSTSGSGFFSCPSTATTVPHQPAGHATLLGRLKSAFSTSNSNKTLQLDTSFSTRSNRQTNQSPAVHPIHAEDTRPGTEGTDLEKGACTDVADLTAEDSNTTSRSQTHSTEDITRDIANDCMRTDSGSVDTIETSRSAAACMHAEVQHVFPQRFSEIWLCFIAIAVVSAAPRGAALLAANSMKTLSVEVAIGSFADLWAPCHAAGQAFTALSEGGGLYKTIVVSDYVFTFLGLTAVAISAFSVFSSPEYSMETRGGRLILGLLVTTVVANTSVSFVRIMLLHMQSPSLNSISAAFYVRNEFVAVTCAMTTGGIALLLFHKRSAEGTGCLGVLKKLRVGLLMAIILVFCISLNAIQNLITNYHLDGSWLNLVMMPAMCKVLLVLLRAATVHEYSLPMFVVGFISVFATSFVSLFVRRQALDASAHDLASVLRLHLILAAVEFASRAVVYWAFVYKTAIDLVRMNTLTLSAPRGIFDVSKKVERRVFVTMLAFWLDQATEIAVIIIISMQELAMPLWSQYNHWVSRERFMIRYTPVVLSLLIQLALEFSVDYVTWRLFFRYLIPRSYIPSFFRKVFTRRMLVCCVGIALQHSLAFWPHCNTCEGPFKCIMYLECLRSGNLDVNGDNICTRYPRNTTNIEHILLDASNTHSNVTIEDLACHRSDVSCHLGWS